MGVSITVYGAEKICASCTNAPSSKDTYEWLEAALSRKFPEQGISISYIDIFEEQSEAEHTAFSQRVIEEDLFYPVIVLNGEIISEGIPNFKVVLKEMEKHGYALGG